MKGVDKLVQLINSKRSELYKQKQTVLEQELESKRMRA
jgi:hypothetical protein